MKVISAEVISAEVISEEVISEEVSRQDQNDITGSKRDDFITDSS